MTESSFKQGAVPPSLSFKPDDVATLKLIEPLLDDLGFADKQEREATRKFCEATIKAFADKFTAGELQVLASAYADGFGCGRRGK